MPIANLSIMEGRNEEQIAALIEAVTEAIHTSLSAPRENIRVIVSEVPRSLWGIAGKSAKELGKH